MYKYVKRVMDIVFSTILLIICFIPMLIVGIAIKLESEGPMLFKQTRTGKDGKNFTLYKFRSMVKENNVLNFKVEDKLTRVGKFIRNTSLDELPQLFNILKGDMSFIGPRPWIVEYYQNFTDNQKRRVEVLPGITGLAQVMGRNSISIFDKIYYDIEYVDNYSLKMDLKVIISTIKTVLSKDGAMTKKSLIKDELQELRENYLSVTGQMPQEKIYQESGRKVFASKGAITLSFMLKDELNSLKESYFSLLTNLQM